MTLVDFNPTTTAPPAQLLHVLNDDEIEEAVYQVRVRARSDAPAFDCVTSNLGELADEAITLAVSHDGTPASLPRWQFDMLWFEFVDTLVTTAVQRRGRR